MIDSATKAALYRVANDQAFLEFLRAEREKLISALIVQTTPHLIHQTQGQIHFVESLFKRIDAFKNL